MIRERLVRATLAAVLAISLPAAVAAQEDESAGPEGIDWTLTSYFDEATGEFVAVPFEVEPTLLLEDGTASGFGGCNQFSGSYELDGGSLSFGSEMTVTLALCDDPAQSTEDAYLAALDEVDGWIIDTGVLEFNDDFGSVILTFEVPGVAWTTGQVAALMATIEELRTEAADLRTEIVTLRDDTESLNVPRLRQRIKALESENKKVKKRLDELESTPVVDPAPKPSGPVTFSAAEKVLLKGIPARIANYCSPLRSSLPKGTRAAVACKPRTQVVSSVDYYLMEGADAARAFGSAMDTFNVPDVVDKTCADGVKSQHYLFGNGWQAEGCYRTNQQAQLRFVDNATDCRKLKAGPKTLSAPALYIALQGTDQDVAKVHTWATRNMPEPSAQLTSITQPIPSKLGASTSCPT